MLIIVPECVSVRISPRVPRVGVNFRDFVLTVCTCWVMHVYECVSPGRIRFGFRGEKRKRRMEEFSYEAHK